MDLGSHEYSAGEWPTMATSLVAISGAAALLAWWSTASYGVGVSPDSTHYIGAARSLLTGQGLRFNGAAYTHWPPLYPALLAQFGAASVDPLVSARSFAALLYALNTALVGCLGYCLSGHRASAALWSALLFDT